MLLKRLQSHSTLVKRNFQPKSYFRFIHNIPLSNHINQFESILSSTQIIYNDKERLSTYNLDWMGKYIGNSSLVLLPKTTQQVSEILKYCYENNLPVVPQGGNTGLVGGSVPIGEEIILSLSKMNKILDIDTVSGNITCEAGCILETLNTTLNKNGLMMPLDLGAKGSCQIGGNLSTNAGGLRYLRYGSLHGNILGLEVVLANGTILNNLSTLRKDNTGYDLKQLFIGSEGTLGVITKACLITPPLPKAINIALLGIHDFSKVMECYKLTRSYLGEILSAFEFFDQDSLSLVKKNFNLPSPLTDDFPYYILIETHGSNKEHDDEKLNKLLEVLMEKEIASDGTLAQDYQQMNKLWKYREDISESVVKHGQPYKYDFSVPLPYFYEIVLKVREYLKSKGYYLGYNHPGSPVNGVVGFGHIGDSNLHLNITVDRKYLKENENLDFKKVLEPFVFELVNKYKGSISAEHGMGQQKNKFMNYSKSEQNIEIMKSIKKLLDPKNILNPNKVLP
ncbi:FAD-binding domain-containing protein [Neoconidiobolus thromboides FSU 785]|nr:FAD-binding domain-containing protein [Neoconidiobolus thromboides FSU 785]